MLAWLESEFITTPACIGHFGLTVENYFLVPGIVLLAGGHGLIRSTVPVLSFFAFDFLFFRVINEEITSSVLLCKPIYQRHFYSNDFKNKPFPFFWNLQRIFREIYLAYLLAQTKVDSLYILVWKWTLLLLLGVTFFQKWPWQYLRWLPFVS